ncbi:hypothetical protein PCE1_002705 [Barthelona sp. PCE]
MFGFKKLFNKVGSAVQTNNQNLQRNQQPLSLGSFTAGVVGAVADDKSHLGQMAKFGSDIYRAKNHVTGTVSGIKENVEETVKAQTEGLATVVPVPASEKIADPDYIPLLPTEFTATIKMTTPVGIAKGSMYVSDTYLVERTDVTVLGAPTSTAKFYGHGLEFSCTDGSGSNYEQKELNAHMVSYNVPCLAVYAGQFYVEGQLCFMYELPVSEEVLFSAKYYVAYINNCWTLRYLDYTTLGMKTSVLFEDFRAGVDYNLFQSFNLPEVQTVEYPVRVRNGMNGHKIDNGVVRINGLEMPITSSKAVFTLDKGEYTLSVEAEGYEPRTQQIFIGGPQSLLICLKPF